MKYGIKDLRRPPLSFTSRFKRKHTGRFLVSCFSIMASTNQQYAIPREFAGQLTWEPAADTRSDEEILAALSQHAPVTGEKNI